MQAAHTLTSHRHAFNLSMREKLKVPLSPLFILLERFNLDLAWHGQPENSKSVYYQNNYLIYTYQMIWEMIYLKWNSCPTQIQIQLKIMMN